MAWMLERSGLPIRGTEWSRFDIKNYYWKVLYLSTVEGLLTLVVARPVPETPGRYFAFASRLFLLKFGRLGSIPQQREVVIFLPCHVD